MGLVTIHTEESFQSITEEEIKNISMRKFRCQGLILTISSVMLHGSYVGRASYEEMGFNLYGCGVAVLARSVLCCNLRPPLVFQRSQILPWNVWVIKSRG